MWRFNAGGDYWRRKKKMVGIKATPFLFVAEVIIEWLMGRAKT
jgi:hypothetical protein